MSFANDIKRFQSKTLDRFVRVKRSASFELFSSVVQSTPVDKGILINNWYLTVNDPSQDTRDTANPSGSNSINQAESELDAFNVVNDVWITNNLPYAIPIEFDGHSAKAPSGMVRANAVNWYAYVNRAIQREKY